MVTNTVFIHQLFGMIAVFCQKRGALKPKASQKRSALKAEVEQSSANPKYNQTSHSPPNHPIKLIPHSKKYATARYFYAGWMQKCFAWIGVFWIGCSHLKSSLDLSLKILTYMRLQYQHRSLSFFYRYKRKSNDQT